MENQQTNIDIEKYLEKLKEEKNPLLKKLGLTAAITKALEPFNIKPIIIGGAAVAFYTAGGYATDDIDFAVVGYEQFGNTLEKFGFEKNGRFWEHPDFDFTVEAPAGYLDGEDAPLTEISVNNWKVYVIGIEDLIIDRLNAYVHWQSEEDGDWALQLFKVQEIDWKYLELKAKENKVDDALKKLKIKCGNQEK